MILQAGNAQHIGGRSSQQDSFGFSDPADEAFCGHAGLLGVVADGMGGLPYGDVASRAAVRAMLDAYMHKTESESVSDALQRSLQTASCALQTLSRTMGDFGTTLLAAAVLDSHVHWVSVGDSALLLLRDDAVRQLNTVHTYGYRGEDLGNSPESEYLTSYLGPTPPSEVDAASYPVCVHDRIIVCSDGLSKVVGLSEIPKLAVGDPQDAAERLVERAVELGGFQQDNVTVLVFAL